MEEAVRNINKNPALSAQEKAAQINQLFANQRVPFKTPELSPCSHYQRQCDIETPCCGENKFYPCRICHDESEISHTLVRSHTQRMKCRKCELIQPVSDHCSNLSCSFRSTYYFCLPCRLWSDDVSKSIFHCEHCGICRLGKSEEHWHCFKCNMCYPSASVDKNTHACLAEASEKNCAVCQEYMQNSHKRVEVLKCGHFMHSHCIKQLNSCPICRKSLFRDARFEQALQLEIASTPMPLEYASKRVDILCNDCEQRSNCAYHFYGLQCTHCQSFNTSVV